MPCFRGTLTEYPLPLHGQTLLSRMRRLKLTQLRLQVLVPDSRYPLPPSSCHTCADRRPVCEVSELVQVP